MINYDVIILTTAVTRPDLHSVVFPKWLPSLNDLNCKWIINIDKINDKSIDETSEHIMKSIIYDNIDLEIISTNLIGGTREAWFNSCQRVINLGYEYKPKFGYFWLEDDWIPTKNFLVKDILKDVDESDWYISLHNRNDISFNPCIFSHGLFTRIMYNKINDTSKTYPKNPERNCCYAGTNPHGERKHISKFIKLNVTKDIGRDWQAKYNNKLRTFNPKTNEQSINT